MKRFGIIEVLSQNSSGGTEENQNLIHGTWCSIQVPLRYKSRTVLKFPGLYKNMYIIETHMVWLGPYIYMGTGFSLVIGFIEPLLLVTTGNYNSLTGLHPLPITVLQHK
jgi:hypothetical protein